MWAVLGVGGLLVVITKLPPASDARDVAPTHGGPIIGFWSLSPCSPTGPVRRRRLLFTGHQQRTRRRLGRTTGADVQGFERPHRGRTIRPVGGRLTDNRVRLKGCRAGGRRVAPGGGR